MPIPNCIISSQVLSGSDGAVIPAGIAVLTVTPNLGYVVSADMLLIGGAALTGVNEWTGGNVTNGVEKVVFSDNANGTVSAAVHYNPVALSNASTNLHVDIDLKQEISVDPGDPFADEDLEVELDDPCCDSFEFVWANVTGPTSSELNDGMIQATANGGSMDYTWSVTDLEGTPQNTFALGTGSYFVTVVDNNCDCEETQQIVLEVGTRVNGTQTGLGGGGHESVNVVQVGVRGDKDEYTIYAQQTDIFINHSSNAEFEIQVVDKGNGNYYDFELNQFTGAIKPHIIKAEGYNSTFLGLHLPSITSTTMYEIFLKPIGQTTLHPSIPTIENPKEIYQRANTVITVTLSTDEGDNWGSVGTVTYTGRPHKRPLPGRDAPFIEQAFTLTATFASGGGKSSVAHRSGQINRSALSQPIVEGIIKPYDNVKTTVASGFVRNDVTVSKLTSSLAGSVLTITGLLSVRQFGSISETLSFDIDTITTLS